MPPHHDLTETILAAFYCVYGVHGYGFPEVVYRRSLARELRDRNCHVVTEAVFNVGYKDEIVGTFKADLLVDDTVVVEIKSAVTVAKEHNAQLVNYLKASRKPIGLLLNFGPEPTVKRMLGPG